MAKKAKKAPTTYHDAWGPTVHPVTGEQAKPGYFWTTTIFGRWFQEAVGTPWTCSAASETYWSS